MTKDEKYFQELRDEIHRLKVAIRSYQDAHGKAIDELVAALQEQVERQQHTIDLLRRPCRCDPPGSGEEFCSKHCFVRENLEANLRGAQGLYDRFSRGQVMALYDAAVKELAGETHP